MSAVIEGIDGWSLEYFYSQAAQGYIVPEDYFCPYCGHQDVWCDESGADYYVGYTYYCTNCFEVFHLL